MLIDAAAPVTATPLEIEAAAAAAESDGYDGFAVPETRHDAFASLALAARQTSRIKLQSAIVVAFARNPMNVAIGGNDVHLVSGGRFQLGLGSQVKPHIERRFGMPWSHPASRMEEFIAAVRAIWASWATGVAGRVADGMLCHSFSTQSYLRERTIPALKAARGTMEGFTLSLPAFVVVGNDERARAEAETGVRTQIAFYGSTPAYRPVLDLHGWGDLHERLNALSRQHAWAEMGALITDDVLDAFAVAGTPGEVAAGLTARFGDVVNRISVYAPYQADRADLNAVATVLRMSR